MGEIEDRKVILEKVFLDLEVELPELFNEQQSNKYPIWLREALSDEKRTSALSYLLDDSILGIILIGGPEEGKTTLCQYISQLYRAQLLGRLDDLGEESKRIEKFLPRIPLRIILREYAQWMQSNREGNTLFHYLASEFSESGSALNSDQIHKIVKNNPIPLILEGLDEVPEKELRQTVIYNIHSFIYQVQINYK